MNKDDKNQIIARYQNRVKENSNNIKALASGTEERRAIRFDVLCEVAGTPGKLSGATVLDLGCGFADFYQHLKNRGIKVNYTGYDINPDLIAVARKNFPELIFEVRDIQETGIQETFDYIICSQTFNNKLVHEDNLALVKIILKLCLPAINKGMVFDFVTAHVDFKEERLYYFSPEELFKYAKSLTKRVTLRHDYPLYEFALYLFPDFKGWTSDK